MLRTVLRVLLSCHVTIRLLQDGVQVQIKSVALQKYVSAAGGGGGNVTVDQGTASSWETFKVN